MKLSRRTLLVATGAALVSNLTACGSQQEEPAPEDAARALTRLGRDLFPHDGVPDAKYQAIAAGFMEQNPGQAEQLAKLLTGKGQPFWTLAEKQRLALIETHMTTPEFQAYRFAVLLGLYHDLSVTRAFGYEGPSFEEYGYIERGFNDLDWLPDPVPAATDGNAA